MARAFEAYIEDTLTDVGIKTQWLAFGTKEENYDQNGMHPYPIGSERARINKAMKTFLPKIFAAN